MINFVSIANRNKKNKAGFIKKIHKIFDQGDFILGKELDDFEINCSKYIGVKHSIGVGNGTDGLYLILKYLKLNKGDEVITTPNSYLASASSIVLAGGKPVFCDIADDLNFDPNSLEKMINSKTKAFICVHLTGRPANLEAAIKICKKYNIKLIEDFSQSYGASYHGKKVGSFGWASAASLHPLKNLAAIGDSGVVCTNNQKLSNWISMARTHGHSSRDQIEFISHNMRMDTIQAAFLNEKIKNLDDTSKKRRKLANLYFDKLKNIKELVLPYYPSNINPVFHTFIIQVKNRKELQKYLFKKNIETKIHYPKLIFELKGFKEINFKSHSPNAIKINKNILSLPICETLKKIDIIEVSNAIHNFYKEKSQ